MPLSHIEHYLILTDDMEATKNWYVNVLGLRVGPTPNFGIPVYWLYIGDRDVVHIGTTNASEKQRRYLGDPAKSDGTGTGALDHVAFRATGLTAMLEHLRQRKVEFKERRVDNQGLYQLFMHDPNGIKVELNFAAAEAEGIHAPVMMSDLA